jgi:hypothetical protein
MRHKTAFKSFLITVLFRIAFDSIMDGESARLHFPSILEPEAPPEASWFNRSIRPLRLRWGFILALPARACLADLAWQVKVVQTVVCSTFTCEAKSAPRRVADGVTRTLPR